MAQVKRFDDGRKERRVLAGLVLSSAVLGKASAVKGREYGNHWSKVVDGLCTSYFERHGKAPKSAIVGLLQDWVDKSRPTEEVAASLESFVREVLAEGKVNVGHCLDEAVDLWNANRVRKALDAATGMLDTGRTNEAIKRMLEVDPVKADSNATETRPYDEPKDRRVAFEDQPKPLFEWDQGLRRFQGHSFCAGEFYAFVGREKVGKSHWLLDVAHRAKMQRHRVAYFQVGDMTQRQITMRLLSRAARWPFRGTPCKLKFPKGMDKKGTITGWDTLKFRTPLTSAKADEACAEERRIMKSDVCWFVLSCHANQSLTVFGLKDKLREMERDGFRPEVIVVDYADNLVVHDAKLERRDAIAETWDHLKQIPMERHCVLFTATQANRVGYKVRTIQMEHVSEDKRKLSHVDGAIGINQQPEDRSAGIQRLNWMVHRHQDVNTHRCVHAAGQLAVANPAMVSAWPKWERTEGNEQS